MAALSDASDDDLERILDGDVDEARFEYADLSGDEAIEDNSLNHEERGDGTVSPPPDKPKKVKKVVLNPQPKLNLESLQGPKGLLALNELFKDHKFHGSGQEKKDLGEILKKLEQWCFRLYPKFHFEDSLKRLEALGKKRELHVYLRKIRSGTLDNDTVRQFDDENDDDFPDPTPIAVDDTFDDLLSQQIQAQTPARTPLRTPGPTSVQSVLTPEQLERIERNRQIAMEKRRQRIEEEQRLADNQPPTQTTLMEVSDPVVEETAILESQPSIEKTPMNNTEVVLDSQASEPDGAMDVDTHNDHNLD